MRFHNGRGIVWRHNARHAKWFIHSFIHFGRGAYGSSIHWSTVSDGRDRNSFCSEKKREKVKYHATVTIAIPERTYSYFLNKFIIYVLFVSTVWFELSDFCLHRSRIDFCLQSSVFSLFPFVFFFFSFWLMTNFEWFFRSLYLVSLGFSLVAAVQWKLQIIFFSFEFGLFCFLYSGWTDNANHFSFGQYWSTRGYEKKLHLTGDKLFGNSFRFLVRYDYWP